MHQYIKIFSIFISVYSLVSCSSSTTQPESDSLRLAKELFVFADGSTSVASYLYATDGTLFKRNFSSGETLERSFTYFTNEAGEIERISYDLDADGEEDEYEDYEYDTKNGLSRIYRYRQAGDMISYRQYTFENGLATKRETRIVENITSADQLGQSAGTLERTLEYQYEDGRQVGFSIDFDSDGVNDGNMMHSYNANGTAASIVHTTVAAGTVWAITPQYESGPCSVRTNSTQNFYCFIP